MNVRLAGTLKNVRNRKVSDANKSSIIRLFFDSTRQASIESIRIGWKPTRPVSEMFEEHAYLCLSKEELGHEEPMAESCSLTFN